MTAPAIAPPPSKQDIEARYGFVGQLARSVPEIRSILDQATREQWTTDRFLLTVANTHWWKTNGAAVREWQMLEATDPQTARDRKGHAMGDIYARANRLGISLTPAQAEEAFYFTQFSGGMSQENIDGYLGRRFFNSFRFDPARGFGQAAETWVALDEMRSLYGMADSPEQNYWVRDQLGKIMAGTQTAEGARASAIAYAKSQFGRYSDRLEAGETIRDIAMPYLDSYRTILERDPDRGLQDQLVRKSLQNGWSLTDFEREARKDPRWSKTVNARNQMANFIVELGKNWGYIG